MAGKGGANPGSGRKTNAEKYALPVGEYTDRCAESLDEAFDKLWELIEGGTRVETKRVKAGTILRKDVARDKDGVPIADKNGRLTPVEVKVFPEVDAEKMVVVEEKTVTMPPDFRAIEYLIDRVCGRTIPSESALAEPPDEASPWNPKDLATLSPEDLDALESLALKLLDGRPRGGPASDPGGPAQAG